MKSANPYSLGVTQLADYTAGKAGGVGTVAKKEGWAPFDVAVDTVGTRQSERGAMGLLRKVGLYKLKSIYPQLECAWFSTLEPPEVRNRFQAFAFQMQRVPLQQGGGEVRDAARAAGGAGGRAGRRRG